MKDVHNEAKDHACTVPECNYKGTSESKLKKHVKYLHEENTQKFQCPHCEHQATTGSTLRYHIGRMHYNVRPYKCTECDFRGKDKQKLDSHMFRKHGIFSSRKYECQACDYKAIQEHILRQHVKAVHDKIKDLVCPHCNFVTAWRTWLNQHIKKVHPKYG